MQSTPTLQSLLLYFGVVVALIVAVLLLSYFLGERHREAATNDPFESGIKGVGDTHLHLPVPYFLVAILFVIFDLEAVYIFAWAVSLQATGWAGFIEITVFILILLAALYYLVKLKALDWGPRGHSPARTPPQQGNSELLVGQRTGIRWDQEKGTSHEQ